MSDVRHDENHAWLGEPARPALPRLALAVTLALWAASWITAVVLGALALAGCTIRHETLSGGPDPGLSRLTLSLFADDQSAWTCSTAPDGTATVSMGGQSNPNAASLDLVRGLADLLAAADPARRSREPPRSADARAACSPFPFPAPLPIADQPRPLVPATPDNLEHGMEPEP